MKKHLKLYLSFGFMLIFQSTYSQNQSQPFDDIYKPLMEYDYLKAFHVLNIKEKYTTVPRGINQYYQALATVCAFNGYKPDSVLFYEYIGLTGRTPRSGSVISDTVNLSPYTPQPAKDYILKEAENHSVIMVNESHTRPENRLFMKSLLDGLHNRGYRYLCIEALLYKPEGYTHYKQMIDEGYYTKEPCYAEMLRQALALGYKIYGYELTSDDYNISSNRDSLMAVHLRDIASFNPEGRMIVYAGHGHISKSFQNSLFNHFETLTGITPLAINQTRYAQKATRFHENILYNAFFERNPTISNPTVLHGLDEINMEIHIFTPRLKFTNGRPVYLFENGLRKAKKVFVKSPSIVKAYYNSDYEAYGEKCVPIDILIVEKSKGEHYLMLPKSGKFKIIISKL